MEEAVFMRARCQKNKRDFALRYDFGADGRWVLTYGVTLQEMDRNSGQSVGNKTIDIGRTRTGPQYKCPYCGSKSFVRCGRCRCLTCYDEKGYFTCAYCNNSGEVKGYIDFLEGKKGESQ